MARTDSIAALLAKVEGQLCQIEAEYTKSLHAQAVDPQLRIDIKNACENMRSALDYIAHNIRERHCPTGPSKTRFYFPILPDQKTFETKLNEWFPGLWKVAPKVAAVLEAVQPYQPGYAWLGHFNQVNNDNKHGDLVEQVRKARPETKVTGAGGGQVSWGPGVKFGSGVSIMGVPVDPRTQLPIPHSSIKVERITWVDFQFAGTSVSALGLLKKALAGVREIEDKIRPLI